MKAKKHGDSYLKLKPTLAIAVVLQH